MIFLGTAIMVVGAALQASAFTLEHFIIGRIITGLGNGGNTSTVPMWQSETCSAHKRGKLVMIEGALITGGIMISYWIDLGLSFAPGSVAWRFPLAFQIAFCLFILTFVLGLPESPRWLILRGREAEAREVIAAIADVDEGDKYVENEFRSIKETVEEMSKGTYADLFTRDKNRTLHRTIIAYVNQMFQQISGINLITYYAAKIYSDLGMSPFMSRLLAALNGTEYFIASWPAVFLVERVGRRKLMLFGAVGQAVTMAILAGVNSRTHEKPFPDCRHRLLVRLQHFLRHWLARYDLVVPGRDHAPAHPGSGERSVYLVKLDLQLFGKFSLLWNRVPHCPAWFTRLTCRHKGCHDHARCLLEHRIQDLHHLRRHQRLHGPIRLLLFP